MTLRLLVLVLVTVALGAAAGTARADAGTTAAPQLQANDPCTLVSFSTGKTDIDIAGQVDVHLDPIGANVQLTGLVGTLLCPLLGGGAPAPTP